MTACPVGLDGRCPTCQRDAGRVWDTATAAGHVLAQAQTRRVLPVRVWPCSCGEVVAGPTRHDAGHAHMTVVAVPLIAAGQGLLEYAAPVVLALYTDGWHLDDALAAAADATALSGAEEVVWNYTPERDLEPCIAAVAAGESEGDLGPGLDLRAEFIAEGRAQASELDENGKVVVRDLAVDAGTRPGTGTAPATPTMVARRARPAPDCRRRVGLTKA